MFSVCLGIVKSESIANDLCQDTFIAVWNYASTFKGKGFKTWILKIARNKSINCLQKQKREVNIDFSESEYLAIADSTDIEKSFILKTVLEKLEPEERQIVLLKNSGMKTKDIATYMGMPRGTVSWHYSEAIKKLKKELEVRS